MQSLANESARYRMVQGSGVNKLMEDRTLVSSEYKQHKHSHYDLRQFNSLVAVCLSPTRMPCNPTIAWLVASERKSALRHTICQMSKRNRSMEGGSITR